MIRGMANLQPGQEFGGYRVIERAGRGGMATVYKALQVSLSRFVALKLLPEHLAEDPDFQARFEREAVAVANLRHPSIPAVHDFGVEDGTSYIVTEYIDGGTLADQMGRPLPVSYVVEVLRPIANALDYAHSRGVLHRDVKPSNILLSRDGRPILNDFGLAQILVPDARLTAQGALMGTPSYMAPEQAEGKELGPAADIYALAIVAYEMLTGRVPFSAATPAAVLLAQVRDPLPMPRSINPAIAPEVESVLVRGLDKDPARRFPTAGQMVAALEGVAHSTAIPAVAVAAAAATGPQAAYETVPLRPVTAVPAATRRPLLAAGAAAVLVLVLGAGAYAFISARKQPAKAGPAALVLRPSASPRPAVSPTPAAAPTPAVAVDAVPRGALVFRAKLTPGTPDLEQWSDVSPPDTAQQKITGTALEFHILKALGYTGDSIHSPDLANFIGEMRLHFAPGAQEDLDWVVAGSNGASTGDHLVRFSPTTQKILIMYMPPGRPAGQDPDTLGAPIAAPWLVTADSHLVDVEVTQAKYTVFVDGVAVGSVDEGRTPSTTQMGVGAGGEPGDVTITDIAAYAVR